MSTSSPGDDNYPGNNAARERDGEGLHGATGFPGRFHPAVHGHEPHQSHLGPHPGSNYVGYLNDPEDPETFTINARDATADDLVTEWLSADENAVVDLEVMR